MRTATHRSCRCYQEPKFRILYVGSDQELLITLRAVLLRPEYHIVSCADRGSAILFLKGDPRYDLLLFNLELSGSTALKLARLTQSLPHRRRTPKISRYLAGNNRQRGRTCPQGWCKQMPHEDRRRRRTVANNHSLARKGISELTDLMSGTASCSDSWSNQCRRAAVGVRTRRPHFLSWFQAKH